jgi:hypothetical protein
MSSINNYLKVTARGVSEARTIVTREEFVFFDDRDAAAVDRAVDESIRLQHLLLGGRGHWLPQVAVWRMPTGGTSRVIPAIAP